MEINFTLAVIISIVFFIIKFINLKFIIKTNEPIKPITIDTVLVFLSVILGLFISDQFGMVKNLVGGAISGKPNAFVAEPVF